MSFKLGAEPTLWDIRPRLSASFRLDAGQPDHVAPLLGFVGDERGEPGRRQRKRGVAELSDPPGQAGIGKPAIDLLAEYEPAVPDRLVRSPRARKPAVRQQLPRAAENGGAGTPRSSASSNACPTPQSVFPQVEEQSAVIAAKREPARGRFARRPTVRRDRARHRAGAAAGLGFAGSGRFAAACAGRYLATTV